MHDRFYYYVKKKIISQQERATWQCRTAAIIACENYRILSELSHKEQTAAHKQKQKLGKSVVFT